MRGKSNIKLRLRTVGFSLPAFLLLFVVGLIAPFKSQPAFANSNGNPVISAAIRSESGVIDQEFVVWSCPDDQGLCIAYHDSSTGLGWQSGEVAGMGPMGSTPTITLDADAADNSSRYPNLYVFWKGQGPNYNLHEAYWNGSGGSTGPLHGGWHGPFPIDTGEMASNPSTAQVYYGTGAGAPMAVAWEGTDGNLWYTESTNPMSKRDWTGAKERAVGPLGSAPSLVDAGGGEVSAWWKGEDGDLWSASVIGTNTYGPCNFHMGSLGSAPSAAWTQTPAGDTYPDPPELIANSGSSSSAPDPAGACPTDAGGDTWYGDQGQYYVCWGAAGTSNGMWCMWWESHANGSPYLEGPFKDESVSLGSAPAIAAYTPYDSSIMAFWHGSPPDSDLWKVGDITSGSTPGNTSVNLGT